ncbi:hypothetical protein [Acidiphilium sp.]|uniref:hypothetical protein n=1 Tax=Acidiphilium sp. TaxID=527 RepID=UPI003CFD2E14
MSATMNTRHGSEYNAFLYAPICEESNGLKLSVLSALARQNIDPWQEAATLARLSTSAARSRLAGAITAALGRASDANNLAATLIVLLPRTAPALTPATDFASRLRAMGDRPRGNLSSMSGRELVVMILVMAGLTIGMHYLLPHHKPTVPPTAQATTSQPLTPISAK